MNARTLDRTSVSAASLLVIALLTTGTQPADAQRRSAEPPVKWTKVSVDMPVSTEVFPPGPGADTVNEYCLMCHSAGMVLRQPPLTESQWLAEVRKMRDFFGMPLPADQDATVARYLVRINGPSTAPRKTPSAAAGK
jgi:hypothetical protein